MEIIRECEQRLLSVYHLRMKRIVLHAVFHAIVKLMNNDLGINEIMVDMRSFFFFWAWSIKKTVTSSYGISLRNHLSTIKNVTTG